MRRVVVEAKVSELLGLTPDELSKRLLPSGEQASLTFSGAGLTPAGFVTVKRLQDLGSAARAVSTRVSGDLLGVTFVFTTGRLSAVDGQQFRVLRDPRSTPSELPGEAKLSLSYVSWSIATRDHTRDDLRKREWAATLLFAPVVIPLEAAHGAKVLQRSIVRARAADAVAELQIGEPPPGGLDGYLRRWSGVARLTSRNGADAQLAFDFGEPRYVKDKDDDAHALHAFVVDGRVAAIGSGFLLHPSCVISSDRRLDCHARPAAE